MERGLVALLLTGNCLASCQVAVDLGDLQFEPPGDVAGRAEDSGARGDGALCAGLYACIFGDGQEPADCLDALEGQERSRAEAVESCRATACGNMLSPEDSLACVLGSCTSLAVACAGGHGDWDCYDFGDAWDEWFGGKGDCDLEPGLLCVFDLLSKTAPGQQKPVANLYSKCLSTIYAAPRTGRTYEGCKGFCAE
jgi:hypothetical protein